MATSTSQVHLALLRGINVGGRNKLPMKDLAEMFREAGCDEVRTYIQSGNVVLSADSTVVAGLGEAIPRAIEERVGLRVPVVLRSAGELRRIVDRNPFVAEGVEPRALHMAFLAERPSQARVDRLEPNRSPPDRFEVAGREIFLCCPGGIGKSKLTTAYFDAQLGTTSTIRNQRTVQKLLELAETVGGS